MVSINFKKLRIYDTLRQIAGIALIFYTVNTPLVGRDSSVGIATQDGLDDLGIESRWG